MDLETIANMAIGSSNIILSTKLMEYLIFGIAYAPLHSKLALIKESLIFAQVGRKWQITGARDFYLGRFGGGSWR